MYSEHIHFEKDSLVSSCKWECCDNPVSRRWTSLLLHLRVCEGVGSVCVWGCVCGGVWGCLCGCGCGHLLSKRVCVFSCLSYMFLIPYVYTNVQSSVYV